jgi:L,D-transpeptidase catalytic domain
MSPKESLQQITYNDVKKITPFIATLLIGISTLRDTAPAISANRSPEAQKTELNKLPLNSHEARKFSFPTSQEKKALEQLINEAAMNPEILDKIVLKVSLSKYMVTIEYDGNDVIRFPIGIGKKGWRTPAKNFVVESLVEDPKNTTEITPNSFITAKWIGFASIKLPNGNYFKLGFHGIPSTAGLGTQESNGCIRMNSEHIGKMVKLVKVQINNTNDTEKRGTPVIISE